MKGSKGIWIYGMSILAFVTVSTEASAITVPDIGSSCSSSVQTDCFNITHNNPNNNVNAVAGTAAGNNAGVMGVSATGAGVVGKTNTTTVDGSFAVVGRPNFNGGGVQGLTTTGTAISGIAGGNYAVYGSSGAQLPKATVFGTNLASSNGVGAYGKATGATSIGVLGEVTGTNSMGVKASAASGYGVYAVATSGLGVYGQSSTNSGLYGISTSGLGIYGQSSSSDAIFGTSTQGNGGTFISSSNFGIYGRSTSNIAIYGTSSSSIALYGLSTSSHGLYAESKDATSRGVFGYNSSGGGVGVWGQSLGASVGVQGENTDPSGWAGFFDGNLGVTGVPRANQSTFSTLSDIRLKKNVQPLHGALEKLLQLRGVTYEWKQPAEHGNLQGPQVGFIAQEVEKVFPSWVAPDPSGFKAITTRGLEAMLVESVRTLQAQNDELRTRVKALEANRGPVAASLWSGGWNSAAMLLIGGVVVIASRRRSRKTKTEQ